jgi:hypothetical protein
MARIPHEGSYGQSTPSPIANKAKPTRADQGAAEAGVQKELSKAVDTRAASRSIDFDPGSNGGLSSGFATDDSGNDFDDLNLEDFRIDQDVAAQLNITRKQVAVVVERPPQKAWVSLHPEWRIHVMALEDRVNRQIYFVSPKLAPDLTRDLVPKVLVPYVTLIDNPVSCSLGGVWPINTGGETGRLDTYSLSAHYIIQSYASKWIRILTNQQAKVYEVYDHADPEWPLPKWPEGGPDYIFKLALRGRIIRNLDHPFVKFLRGRGNAE